MKLSNADSHKVTIDLVKAVIAVNPIKGRSTVNIDSGKAHAKYVNELYEGIFNFLKGEQEK